MVRNPSEPGKSRTRREVARPLIRRTSVDFVQLDAAAESGSTGRRRLQLLPRTVGVLVGSPTEEPGELPLESTVEEPPAMTEEQAKQKVAEDVKEFMQIRDLNEANGYFEALPVVHRHLLVSSLVGQMDFKEADLRLIEDLFARVAVSGACSAEVFELGFSPLLEGLDDISVDVPNAYPMAARLLVASKLSKEAVERLSGMISVYGTPSVEPKERLMREYSRGA